MWCRIVIGFATKLTFCFQNKFQSFSFLHAALHIVVVMYFCAETFMSMLHNTSHSPLFLDEYSWFNLIIPYVLCPFFGQTWNTYFFHHVKHHHVEDNSLADLSSTRGYQRDSRLHFLIYFLRFALLIQIELPWYFVRKGQVMCAFKALFGEICSLGLFAYASYMNFYASLAVFLIPFCAIRFGMMAANWGQHAFINSDEKHSHSVTIVNSTYNRIAFNDGFHASHHNNSLRHWTDHPSFSKDADFVNITFSGNVNFGDIWYLLMTQNYDELERMLVFKDKKARPSKKRIILELHRQLAPLQ